MKNTKTRFLSLFLALMMLLGMGTVALADSDVSVALVAAKTELLVGQKTTVEAIISPSDADIKNITWTSDNKSVLTVTGSGTTATVTAVAAGSAAVTFAAKYGDEDITETLTITVKENAVTAVGIYNGTAQITSLDMAVGKTVSLTAQATLADGSVTNKDVEWSSADPTIVNYSSTGTLTAISVGSTVVTATIGGKSASINVNVKETVFESVKLNASTATVARGSTLYLTATLTPSTLSSSDYTISWASANTNIATVSGTSVIGTVRGVAAGSTTITVTVTSGGVTKTASCAVTVTNTSKNIYITLDGVSEYTFSSKDSSGDYGYDIIADAIGSSFSYIQFGNRVSGSVGTLYSNSSLTALSTTASYSSSSSGTYTTRKLHYVASDNGTYAIAYAAYNATGTATVASGYLYITVENFNNGDVVVTLDDDDPYTFDEKTKADKASAVGLIEEYLYDNTNWTSSYDYDIFFTKFIDEDAGTLYTDSGKKTEVTKRHVFYSNPGSADYDIADLYFVPDEPGIYEVEFTIEYEYKSGSSTRSSELDGILQIVVPGETASDVTLYLDDNDGYSFDETTKRNSKSAESLINTAIGRTYSYIKFSGLSTTANNKVGTLYDTSNTLRNNPVTASTEILRADLGDLYFEPKANVSGTYSVTYIAYNASGTKLASGTLSIVVGSASGEADLYISTTTSTTITLDEADFLDWYQEQTGSNYKLAYVTIDGWDMDDGTFKIGSTTFDPDDNSYVFYSSSFSGTKGSNPRYLEDVKYTSARTTGTIYVDFTCYGGTTTNAYSTKKSGTLAIFVTKNDVENIAVAVNGTAGIALKESDFLSVYKTAMGTTSSSTKFYIELLDIPAKGTLYYNYTSASKPGTKLTANNVGNYELYVNGSSSQDSVEDITYVPVSATGSASVQYIAYSTSGEALYMGTINFNYATARTMSITSEGYKFAATDFFSLTDSDPVYYLTFQQPTSGKLYVNYEYGSGTAITSATRLYTLYATYGEYPITGLTYIPRAGYSGSVTLSYTAHTQSGNSYTGTITATISTKRDSAVFSDVKATTSGNGALWMADPIDFANKWGLVQGTDTTAKTFSPNDTMRRCDLVLILYRAAGSPKVTGTLPYTDIPSGAYYYDSALWAAQNNLMTGVVTGTTYNPNGAITRQDFATILYNYTRAKGVSVTNSGSLSNYKDAGDVASYATAAVTWAVAKGYITSMSTTENILSPASSATRAQIATLLHRYFTY